MSEHNLEQLRDELDEVNLELLERINHRAKLVQDIGQLKGKQSMNRFDPVRERSMLDKIIEANTGPFASSTVENLFKEIFKSGFKLQNDNIRKSLYVTMMQHPKT